MAIQKEPLIDRLPFTPINRVFKGLVNREIVAVYVAIKFANTDSSGILLDLLEDAGVNVHDLEYAHAELKAHFDTLIEAGIS